MPRVSVWGSTSMMNQNRLKEALDQVVESCVNFVGGCEYGKHLLTYVSGLRMHQWLKILLNTELRMVVSKAGEELKKYRCLVQNIWAMCRVSAHTQCYQTRLDNSAVHRKVIMWWKQWQQKAGSTIRPALIQQGRGLRKQLKAKDFYGDSRAVYHWTLHWKSFEKLAGPQVANWRVLFMDGVSSMEDVKPGMKVPGIITNIPTSVLFVMWIRKTRATFHLANRRLLVIPMKQWSWDRKLWRQ